MGHIFELEFPHVLYGIVATHAICGHFRHQNAAAGSQGTDAGGHIHDVPAGRVGPTRPRDAAELGGPHKGTP